jgi:hypothetical protein
MQVRLKIREFIEEREKRLRPLAFGNSSKCRKNVPVQKEAQLSSYLPKGSGPLKVSTSREQQKSAHSRRDRETLNLTQIVDNRRIDRSCTRFKPQAQR